MSLRGAKRCNGACFTAVGAEIEDHSLDVLYMHTRLTEDKAILAEIPGARHIIFLAMTPMIRRDWAMHTTI